MEHLTVGELAKQSKVNLETIRYYERQGLLSKPPRLQSGYRAFPTKSVKDVRFIKQAQELGFSLKEIKELLALHNNPKSTGADIRKRAETKLAEIASKMKTLKAIKKELTELMASCDGKSSIEDCPIMKSLNSDKK